ncbi:MAG: DUF1847 domain-containing protein [Sporomusaceae bacterium]|jgi:uncharacterized metal-binding protein|nr:DUF1847 domain-containing protein [Sporomusaceae bacterium]
MYTCANCAVLACGDEFRAKMPVNCPMCQQDTLQQAFAEYDSPENKDFFIASAAIEAVGYGQWTRLKEIIEFCKRLGYKKIGLAFCRGLKSEAKVINKILTAHDLEVVSVICKTGGIAKELAGIEKQDKLRPEQFEPMCNPIGQAMLLNEQNTQFNIAVGLCVGHDSLFYKYSNALVTTLITKDRVLANNPAGAVYCAESYYRDKLLP